MTKIDKELVKSLENGEISGVRLNSWFLNHNFEYIKATIWGCLKTNDYKRLSLISMYAQKLLFEPNAKDFDEESLIQKIKDYGVVPVRIEEMSHEELITFWNSIITDNCEQIIECITIVIAKLIEDNIKNFRLYHPMMAELYNCPNDHVRLYCAANLDCNRFIDDKCPRVKKVANIRRALTEKYINISAEELSQINFLTSAITSGAIECFDGCVGSVIEDEMYAEFWSLLFKNGGIKKPKFDKDIFYTIRDTRVLADTLNQFIKNGELSFNENMTPICFQKTDSRGHSRKRTN